ncbi:histidine biosynthesis [Artemisia annua]|uniref:Histidine biosynthesis n=1 Tax=Artemisia annua TaxID=35608 RepID=A0A2U1PXP3_ARTAN|nr:histidine biosynthesis [Artemisia annua]
MQVKSLETNSTWSRLDIFNRVLRPSTFGYNGKQKFVTTPSWSSRSRCLSIRCGVKFRPCIDIHKGKVKQIVGSTLSDMKGSDSTLVTNFESDKSAAEYAALYKEDGLVGGHVIMLGADPLSNESAIGALHAYPGRMDHSSSRWSAVGGGINSGNALSYIEEGASHVIITSYVFNNGQMDHERLKELVHIVGKERLVLDLSCRKKCLTLIAGTPIIDIGMIIHLPLDSLLLCLLFLEETDDEINKKDESFTGGACIWFQFGTEDAQFDPPTYATCDGKYAIVTDRWQKFSDVYLDERVLNFLSTYADEFLVHGVDVEDIDNSPEYNLLLNVLTMLICHLHFAYVVVYWFYCLQIPVTYAGGVTIMDDMERIKVAGMGRVDVTVVIGSNLGFLTLQSGNNDAHQLLDEMLQTDFEVSTKGSRKRIKSNVECSLNPSGKHRKKNCRFCKSSMNDHNQTKCNAMRAQIAAKEASAKAAVKEMKQKARLAAKKTKLAKKTACVVT